MEKEIGFKDFDEMDNLVINQTEMVNEKVRKRLELVTPKKPDTPKTSLLETPTTAKKKSTIAENKTNPLKEVKNFNEMFLQEADKLRITSEAVVEEVENKEQQEVKCKPLNKERKVQIQTVAQVHKDGNELDKIVDPIQKEEESEQSAEFQPTREDSKNIKTFSAVKNTKENEFTTIINTKQKESPTSKNPKLKELPKTKSTRESPRILKTEKNNDIKCKSVNETPRHDDSNDADEEETDEDDDDVVVVETESSSDDGLDMEMRSHTPSSMRSSDYAYHLNFIKRPLHQSSCPHQGNCKPTNRKNMSFTNMRLREIERQNEILLKKILTQKPSYLGSFKKPTVPQKVCFQICIFI